MGKRRAERKGDGYVWEFWDTNGSCSGESISIAESWVTDDVRPGREEEKWLNLLLQKR